MRSMKVAFPAIALGAALALLASTSAFAGRCNRRSDGQGGIEPHCGLDSQTEPPNPALGDRGGCTEASIATNPLFRGTHQCEAGDTMVIYDLTEPFPNNHLPGDQTPVGSRSYVTMRARPGSPCEHMTDSVDPKPCADPAQCPGELTVPVAGYIVACWSPRDRRGCRDFKVYSNGSTCLHVQHELLGPGCDAGGDLDCPHVSAEQISIDNAGTASRHVCPANDPTLSCRGTRTSGRESFRLLYGGFCSTSNCESPGVAPVALPEPGPTCVASWGQMPFGYENPPGRGINTPGWYDWKTGAIKVDLTHRTPTCGPLGVCMGREGPLTPYWDLSLVAVPRPGQAVPCSGDACDAAGCF